MQGHRKSWLQFALITASIVLTLAQAMSAPADSHHHADAGTNVLFHVLGPALLAIVPLLSLLLIFVHRLRGGHLGTLQLPMFMLVAASTESAGLLLGIAHHGIATTLLLAAIGIACSCLTLAAGAVVLFIVKSERRRPWPKLQAATKPSLTGSMTLNDRLAFDTVSLRGPPHLA